MYVRLTCRLIFFFRFSPSLLFFILILIGLSSCTSDDNSSTSFLIDSQYVYRVPDCNNDIDGDFVNSCVAFIEFYTTTEAGVLPGGDVIYNIDYEIENQTIKILYSEIFVEGIDRLYTIESQDVLVEQESGNRYVRE